MKTAQLNTIIHTLQHDASRQGHAWRTVGRDVPPSTLEEIAAEILDGRESCGGYTATSGERYRWGKAKPVAA